MRRLIFHGESDDAPTEVCWTLLGPFQPLPESIANISYRQVVVQAMLFHVEQLLTLKKPLVSVESGATVNDGDPAVVAPPAWGKDSRLPHAHPSAWPKHSERTD